MKFFYTPLLTVTANAYKKSWAILNENFSDKTNFTFDICNRQLMSVLINKYNWILPCIVVYFSTPIYTAKQTVIVLLQSLLKHFFYIADLFHKQNDKLTDVWFWLFPLDGNGRHPLPLWRDVTCSVQAVCMK